MVIEIIDTDQSSLVKTNINLIRCEKDKLSELLVELDTGIAKTILSKQPTTETEYKLAELEARIKYRDLYTQILEKENEIDSLEKLLEHKEDITVEYKKFENKLKSEFGEHWDLLKEIMGDE